MKKINSFIIFNGVIFKFLVLLIGDHNFYSEREYFFVFENFNSKAFTFRSTVKYKLLSFNVQFYGVVNLHPSPLHSQPLEATSPTSLLLGYELRPSVNFTYLFARYWIVQVLLQFQCYYFFVCNLIMTNIGICTFGLTCATLFTHK